MDESQVTLSDKQAWQQYCQVLQSYEFYWNIVLKISGFFYLLVGSIGAFYMANRNIPNLQWLLFFGSLFGLLKSILYFYAALWIRMDLQYNLDTLAQTDVLSLEVWKDTRPLAVFLIAESITGLLVVLFAAIATTCWGTGGIYPAYG